MLDSRPKGRGFEPHRRHCIVSLSKNINPSLVLVQPRKTRPFITERLLMGCKESYQTKNQTNVVVQRIGFVLNAIVTLHVRIVSSVLLVHTCSIYVMDGARKGLMHSCSFVLKAQ